MVRHADIPMLKLSAALVCAALLLGSGCIGGAHPEPPFRDPAAYRDAGAPDGSSGWLTDAGAPASDAAGPPSPPPDDSLADFAEANSAPGAAGRAAGVDDDGWPRRVYIKPPWAADAGAAPADSGVGSGSADAH